MVKTGAFRFSEQEENQKKKLVEHLMKGEASGFVEKADRKKIIEDLHSKHRAKWHG